MKKLMMLAAILALVLVAAAPVIAQVSFEIGDQEVESGEMESETNFAITGDNNNACLGLMQFANTGNFTNQQGQLQYATAADDVEFAGPETEIAPSNATECEQAVQQSAAASG